MNKLDGAYAWSNDGAPKIIAKYDPLVKRIASTMRPQAALGHCLDSDDLVAEGRVAVLEAVATYEGYGSTEFGWVARRVRYRMLDAIRRLDVRSRTELDEMASEREQETPSEQVAATRMRHLAFVRSELELDPLGESQESEASARELADLIATTIEELPERERVVASSIVIEGELLSDVAERLGVTVARVSQLYRSACDTLRSTVTENIR